eukprot:TRINITY_DN2671_c2_g1_i1.p1 TRINITY_DN2671_c2_g1~~TRINITY_DN2671_c2_g1_i1.p1  ORF type:complete len:495 (+),score=72.39 TRINITY_DN2671_c2_g1_i1:89-1573(+)
MSEFYVLLAVLLCVAAAVQYVAHQYRSRKQQRDEAQNDASEQQDPDDSALLKSFQWNYLVVYYVVMEADWLQGPYVYALYRAYGFEKEDIAILFIAGFTSSMFFGTFVGSLADKYGRKRMCQAFGIIYGLSCMTKLVPDFYVLLFGRLLAGIATSLLFSVFEAWMVFEHFKNGFSPKALSDTFSLATFGNGISAILAGLLAALVQTMFDSYVAPFMLAIIFLVIATSIETVKWAENYGDSSIEISKTLVNALSALRKDNKILILGCVQSLFEGAMYVFVFMWTPALESDDPNQAELPYGIIFACFMVCVMIGSSVFSILVHLGFQLETIGMGLLATSALALFIPYVSTDIPIILFSFLLFEACCGVFWPCFGTLRGQHIPEDSRATIMNFFRVPLNLFVVVVLLKVSVFSTGTVFLMCVGCLVVALTLTSYFTMLQPTTNTAQQQQQTHRKATGGSGSGGVDGGSAVDNNSSDFGGECGSPTGSLDPASGGKSA